ncbi:MAG TPA: formylglycine-generating enzyme family protein, partial [Actinomycetota bacterium]
MAVSETDPRDPDSGGAPEGMVWIPGGTFLMGSNDHYPEEAPAHPVS